MRMASALVAGLLVLAAPSRASEPALAVSGQVGFLGEWELNGTLHPDPGRGQGFTGDLTLTHTGFCTQDGPETKSARMTLRRSRTARRVTAVMHLDGTACAFDGRRDHGYHGKMRCPGREPVPLILWIR